MSDTKTATGAPRVDKPSEIYGSSDFKTMATAYHEHKRIVDACSGYDNVDDAIAGLKKAWTVIALAAEKGSGYTPKNVEGFGSEPVDVVAQGIMGTRKTVGSIRKALNAYGK